MMSNKRNSAVMRVVRFGVLCTFCAGLFISCGTTGAAGPAGAGDTEPLPVWVLNPPVDEEYFLGIGGSNTGNREADMEQARLNALADLAARISTKIRGEMVLESGEDDRGNRRQSFSRRIEENVSQELRGVEPVDAYYSPEEGFWYYYRFPKAELDRARDDLKRRVRDLVFPREGGADAPEVAAGTAAERLAVLGRGFDLIMESPFVGTLRVEEVRYTGALIDYIEAELRRELGTLEILLEDGVISGELGDLLVLEARVRAAGAA
ncbi:MAG: LPP20 family lipoprotein, partial [Spirochaetota bacterium]